MTRRKVSLTSFLRRLQADREPQANRALAGLVGQPAGGWPETQQAIQAIREALPLRHNRTFSAAELIQATMTLNRANRYAWKEVQS